MNFTQITTFQAVMTSGSFSGAAVKLGRTQPAVSAAIKSLEEGLGLKLFERNGRKLVPVPEAHYLLSEADTILARMSRVRQTMHSLVDGQTGDLNVAAMPGPVSLLFPRFVARQIGDKQGFRVQMVARTSNQIAELARAQNIDFGFCDAPTVGEGNNFYETEVITGDCFVAMPLGHRLATQTKISFADLSGEPMGTLPATLPHQSEVLNTFRNHGLSFVTMVECQTFQPILQFVIARQCCAILDPLSVAHIQAVGSYGNDLVIRPLAQVLRYRYAILSPRYRPMSVIATRMRDAWRDELQHLMTGVGAHPEFETGRMSDGLPP